MSHKPPSASATASDKGQRDLCVLFLGITATALAGTVVTVVTGLDARALTVTLVIGVVAAGAASLFSLLTPDFIWLKAGSAAFLLVHGVLLLLVLSGRITPPPTEDPTATPTPTVTLLSPSPTPTGIPTLSPVPTATPPFHQTRPPLPTPTVAELATPTPTAVRVTPRAQTPTSSTATPTPRLYPAPQMLFPNDGHSFSSQELPTLRWEAIPNLAPGDRYLLHLEHGGGVHWEVIEAPQWTAADFGFRGLQPANGRYIWWVAVCRNAAVGASGTQPCELASPTSEPRGFAWLTPSDPTPMSPPPADPTPTSPPPVITPDS